MIQNENFDSNSHKMNENQRNRFKNHNKTHGTLLYTTGNTDTFYIIRTLFDNEIQFLLFSVIFKNDFMLKDDGK